MHGRLRKAAQTASRLQTSWGAYVCARCLTNLKLSTGAQPQHEVGTPAWGSRYSSANRSSWRGFATKAEEYDVITVDAGLVVVDGYDDGGFVVNNSYLEGSVLCSGELATLWRVDSLASLTRASLSLLLLMRPAPDLLIIGCGEKIERLTPELEQWLADSGIAVECLDTANAVSTFNILNQEGRKVVAALLPSSL